MWYLPAHRVRSQPSEERIAFLRHPAGTGEQIGGCSRRRHDARAVYRPRAGEDDRVVRLGEDHPDAHLRRIGETGDVAMTVPLRWASARALRMMPWMMRTVFGASPPPAPLRRPTTSNWA